MKSFLVVIAALFAVTAFAQPDQFQPDWNKPGYSVPGSGYPEDCRSVAEKVVQECRGSTSPVLTKVFPVGRYHSKTTYWYEFKKREGGRTKTCNFMITDSAGWRCDLYDPAGGRQCGAGDISGAIVIRGCR